MTTVKTDDPRDVAGAVERLRLAEARLARRRQTDCGPSENARAAMRLILDRADEDDFITPTEIANALGVSTASVTGMLDRLHAGGLIGFAANPADRRSKYVVPFDRSVADAPIDPITAEVTRLAASLPTGARGQVVEFLERIREVIDAECA